MKSFSHKLAILFSISILLIANLEAQSLISGAESVAFDTLNNRYLVSSLNTRKIISVDLQGNQTLFKEGIQAFGNCIKDNVFYVSGGTHVRGLDVNTAEIVIDVNIPGTQQLDGLTADNEGNLYAVETVRNRIYKINLSDNSVSEFASAGEGNFPQDIIYDEFKNRLLLVFWHANSSILSYDIETAEMDTAVTTETGFFDGISIDDEGNIYLASHDGDGKIIMYDNNFENPPAVISEGYDEPAGLDVNLRDNILSVPSFAGNRVDFIQLPAVFLSLEVESSDPRGHIPHEVSFRSVISGNPPVTSWEWDFNSDGVIDSYDENPQIIFDVPGSYTVKLKVYSDSLVREVNLENYVQAFNGESSIEFNGEGGDAAIEAAPELALGDVWTFAAWIKPRSLGRDMIFFKNAVQIYTNGNAAFGLNAQSLVIRINKEDGNFTRISTPDSSLKIEEWQHIAVSYDYNNTNIGVYINGQSVGVSEADSNIFTGRIADNIDDSIILGNNIFGIRNFTGAIDNLELWANFMDENEIKTLMQTGRTGEEEGLIGLWNMDDGSGSNFLDKTPNSNHGILTDVFFTHGVDLSLFTGVRSNERVPNYPREFMLYQNYPNPFNPETTIKFNTAESSHVILNIYNIQGELIKTLINRDIMAGSHYVVWDGKDSHGIKVVSGIYFYRFINGANRQSRKMILLK